MNDTVNDEETIIKTIENLIVGKGANNFRELEHIVDVFCPFEAIGMVRQEIRHSNFLSYILDPNRPHIFGTKFLEEFLAIIIEAANDEAANDFNLGFSRMDLHFMDLSNVRVLREWKNIDILFELAKTAGMKKGIVVAVELKIDASESETQLGEYNKTISQNYLKDKWDHVFVYLTKNNTDPSEENRGIWVPIGLANVIDRLAAVQDAQKFKGPSADLFMAYVDMLRRHILDNEKLKDLVKNLWSKHAEALEAIYEHKPDMRGDIMDNLANDALLATKLSKDTNFKLVKDKSSRNYLRFTIQEWENVAEMMSGDATWLDSDNLMSIELHGWSKLAFKISYVIGPGDSDSRQKLFDGVMKVVDEKKLTLGRRKKVISNKWQHLSSANVFSDDINDKMSSEESVENIVDEIIKNANAFLKETLPKYDKIINEVFEHSTADEHETVAPT